MATANVTFFDKLGMGDVNQVGGKNASLGEMIKNLSGLGVKVPNGFATTAVAFNKFLEQLGLQKRIYDLLDHLDVNNIQDLQKAGNQIREWIIETPFLQDFEKDVRDAFDKLVGTEKDKVSFAVRSSATAEDLPNASFAGQQETFLNVEGIDNIFIAIKKVFASLFNDRAISYRVHKGFDHRKVALSAGIQRMVRSDKGSSGVAFSIDTESGFDKVIFITGAYGLGETVVQGIVNPDEFYLYKPNLKSGINAILRKNIGEKAIKMVYAENGKKDRTETVKTPEQDRLQFILNNEELHELGRYIVTIEEHYGRPMDIEWAKDGENGLIYIVQARPETVKSQVKGSVFSKYVLRDHGKTLSTGRSIGQKIGVGKARVLKSVLEIDKVRRGDVLVTDMTDPDWEPIMKKSAAIVTNRGGRTCHAAIIARELGIPAVVGCKDATSVIIDGQEVTVSCSEGEVGYVYDGIAEFDVKTSDVENMPKLPLKIMMNIGNPDVAFQAQFLPNDGVGLARIEFVINKMIGIHPSALLNFDKLNVELKAQIEKRIAAYKNPVDYYVNKLAEGIAVIAAAFYPKPVIVRTSDFKTNEYANLIGGKEYELVEENPMIGFRGASRYVHPSFAECFKLECQALKKVRDEMGFTNIWVMIPFVRTVEEGRRTVELLEENGLRRGDKSLKVIMMCEIPSNAILAEEFLKYFDGFSIGSNDLTQLTLGLDRDSSIVANLFDERNAAVKWLIERAITTCNKLGKYIGICGQGPSDYPDFAEWLMQKNIASISLNPDTVVKTWDQLFHSIEKK